MFNRTPTQSRPNGEDVTTPIKPIPPRSTSAQQPPHDPNAIVPEWIAQSTLAVSWSVANVAYTLETVLASSLDRLIALNPDESPDPAVWCAALATPDGARLSPMARALADEFLAEFALRIVRARDDQRQRSEAAAREAAIGAEATAKQRRIALEARQEAERQAIESRRHADTEASRARAQEARQRWDSVVAAAR